MPTSSTVGSDELFQSSQGSIDSLGHLKQRWDNRLVLEQASLWESHLRGDLDIALYGDAFALTSGQQFHWLVSISSDVQRSNKVSPNSDVTTVDLRNPDNGDDLVMFVNIGQSSDGPEVRMCIPARFYFFCDEVRSVREGLLYRTKGFGGFKVLPFFRERKVEFATRSSTSLSMVDPNVEGFSEIVDSVAYDCAKELRDRFFGDINECLTIWFGQEGGASFSDYPHVEQRHGKGCLMSNQRIDVAFGPFNL